MASPSNNRTVRQVRPGSHTASNTWVSANAQEHGRYARIEINGQRLFPRSEVMPRTWVEWLGHRVEMMMEEGKVARRALDIREQEELVKRAGILPAGPCKVGLSDHRGAVLAMPTIWCKQPEVAGRATAGWPCQQELKWEGDERAKNDFGRFFPLPREPGNQTVAWHHLRVIQPHHFDRVRPVPTAEDIAWAANVDQEPRWDLVLSSTWDAIEEEL